MPPDLALVPDEDLMLMVANGVIEAPATELFRRHNRGLYNFVAWLCKGQTAEAEDITQRTWVKLMTRCADYAPRAAFRTFLFQIARNTWLDVVQSAGEQMREGLETLPEQPSDDLSAEAALAFSQDMDRVRGALMRLPAVQREVVALRYFSDMSLEDVAATVGVGFETAKSRLRYAFARLRAELQVQP